VTPGTWTAALAVAAFAAAWGLTGMVRHYARNRLLDHPNERSSHTNPTPKGGGLAVVAAFVAAGIVLAVAGVVETRVAIAVLGGTAAISLLGWIDDHRYLPNRLRFAFHLLAGVWAMAWLRGLPVVHFGGGVEVRVGLLGSLLGVVGIVWAINLYNFMDGIDGLAAGEAASVGLAAAVLLWLLRAPGLAALSLLLAAAAAGFLVWNWHPARIFMGDVGSGFLGFTFAGLAVASERAGAVPLLAWVIVLGVFVFDATATLVRRARRGERWHEAHRSHAYQRATPSRAGHGRVTAAVVGVNAVLGALAAAGTLSPRWLLPAFGAALVLVGALYLAVERRWPMTARARS